MKKPRSTKIPICLLWAIFFTFITGCQIQAGPVLPIGVTPTNVSSAETPSPTPAPTPDRSVEAGNANNPYAPFPYKKVSDFGEIKAGKLSGIVYHPQRGTLFAVRDTGQIIEIKPDGTLINDKKIQKKADFEGIAYNPFTGMLYVAIEGEEVILEVNPENLKTGRKIPIDRTFEGDILLSPEGNGIEGITFVPAGNGAENGSFYLVNQSNKLEGPDPSIVFEIEINHADGESKARVMRYFSVGVTDLSGIHYVAESDRLFIISDANNLLLLVSLSGEVLESSPLPGNKQEGITVDGDGFLYVAQDAKKSLLKFTSLDKADNTTP